MPKAATIPNRIPLDAEGDAPGSDELKAVERLQDAYAVMRQEIGKIIVGQDEVLTQLLIAVFARSHCLLVGVPGLAKTLLVSTLARVLSLEFKRIQFTPDLMPADITGTEIIQEDPLTHERSFKFLHGPIFANVILADEINRTPPKTQSALLEAMQEHRVTAGGHTYTLEEPFFVLATQNPIEQEGTYPLPEAQLDRFMFLTRVNYPSLADEAEILRRTTATSKAEIRPLLNAAELIALQRLIRRVPVPDHVYEYAVQLVRSSRPGTSGASTFINAQVNWGAGPRAGQFMILGAKARAVLDGRTFVTCDDIRSVAHPALRHRILPNYSAESQGIDADAVVDWLLKHTPTPVDSARPGRRRK